MMDYRRKAADTVMRKSMDALSVFANEAILEKLHVTGLADQAPDAPASAELVLETTRALDMARAALFDVDSNKEDGRDG